LHLFRSHQPIADACVGALANWRVLSVDVEPRGSRRLGWTNAAPAVIGVENCCPFSNPNAALL
jgi:hypothetical protein